MGGWNRFGYVGGNAVGAVDPTGLQVPGSWSTIFGGHPPTIPTPPVPDYIQVRYSGPVAGVSLTMDRNLNIYLGVNTGCIACTPSPQACIGNVNGPAMSGTNLSDFIQGAGGQASAGQFGIGYGWAFSSGRTSSEITFGGLQAPGAGSGGYTWQIYASGRGR
jgi:hypothetical protein